jgi:hypothetical protein
MRKFGWIAAAAATVVAVLITNARINDQHVAAPSKSKRPPSAAQRKVQRPGNAVQKQKRKQQPRSPKKLGTKPKPQSPPIGARKSASPVAPLAFLSTLPTVPAPTGNMVTVRLPAGIDATGLTDVSDQLNAFFAALPNQRTVLFGAGATYRIEKPVLIKDKTDLVLDGNGARTITRSRGDRTRQHWRLLRGERIVIRDLTVVGAHPAGGVEDGAYVATLEAQHGFNIAGTRGLDLDRVTVSDVYGDFIYLGWDSSSKRWTEDVRIHHSTFTRNGRQGIAFTGARRVRIDHNTISEVRRATFDLEPNGGATGVEKVLVENNVVRRGRLNFVSAVGSGPVSEITVRNNTLQGRAMNSTIGNFTERRRAWAIVGNRTDTSYGTQAGAVIGVRRVDGLLVTGNTQRVQAGRSMYLVSTSDVCGVSVGRNIVRNGSGQQKSTKGCSLPQRHYRFVY